MTGEAKEIQQGIYLLEGEGEGSHHYLIRAAYRNVLIDSGLDQDFLCLQEQLLSLVYGTPACCGNSGGSFHYFELV